MARVKLSNWQAEQVRVHLSVHEKMLKAEKGFAPTAVYYEGNGRPLGQLVTTPQSGDNWMAALLTPLSMVDRLAQVVVAVEITAVDGEGADEMVMVIFARRGRLPLAVPIPFDRVGGEVVYGQEEAWAGPLQLADAIERAWQFTKDIDGWPDTPYEQFLLVGQALTEKGDALVLPA